MKAFLQLVAAAVISGACAGRAPAPTNDPRTASDSLRGVVERVGSEPGSALILRASDDAACALILPPPPPPLDGLEVVVWGARRAPSAPMPGVPCAVAVQRYAVRAVDGAVAHDGRLRLAGSDYSLETTDGVRHPLREVPAALRAMVGARVFWAGSLDRAPVAYGVLTPPIR